MGVVPLKESVVVCMQEDCFQQIRRSRDIYHHVPIICKDNGRMIFDQVMMVIT